MSMVREQKELARRHYVEATVALETGAANRRVWAARRDHARRTLMRLGYTPATMQILYRAAHVEAQQMNGATR